MKRFLSLVAVGIASLNFFSSPVVAEAFLKWEKLPELPAGPGQDKQVGVAGPFVGVHNDALLVAGGANFPDALPWEGGSKVWYDQIFVLVRENGGEAQWHCEASWKLPRPLAYGVSLPTSRGLLCVGGCDAESCMTESFFLKWDSEAKRVDCSQGPPLPRALAFMAGALVNDIVVVAGGQETMKDAQATGNVFAMDLAEEPLSWRKLPTWPGPERVVPLAAAQSDGQKNLFYLFSGRYVGPGKASQILKDAYSLDPQAGTWTRLADVGGEGSKARCVMAGTCIASGANHILVFGGAGGTLFEKLEALERRIAADQDPDVKEKLIREKNHILDNHPGFSKEILAFHTITGAWSRVGELPEPSQVTTSAVWWQGNIVIPSGEVRPGVRTRKVWQARLEPPKPFGTVNYGVLGAYLAVLVGMGVYFAKRERSTDDFFRAGRRIPWWAAGLSIFGTQLSAITFMAIPAKTFATDWRYFMANMSIPLTAPIIILLFLPFYRKLDVTTAYEYLEKRFNLGARLLGSLFFMILQLGRIGIVLLLPSIALSMVTGIPMTTCILLMGALSILYTVLGGIEAVIWTDVLQVVVLLGGALLSLILIVLHVDGGISGLVGTALREGKLHTFDFRFTLTSATLWVVVLGGISANLISYGSDQAVIQRYLTTRDEKAAANGIWTNAIITIPASLLFFFLGTALFVFFRVNAADLNPTLPQTDAIFPWYIVSQLPVGVAGLLIAGVFAASMSSLDSSMNSVATTVTTDWYQRWISPESEDHSRLVFARWVTAVVGIVGTCFALVMAQWEIKSLWDQFSAIIGLFAGGLAGLFLLGMLSKRANGWGGIVGLLASGGVQYFVKAHTEIYLLLYTFTGLVSCVVIGWLASFLLPGTPSVQGLTVKRS